MTTDPGRPPAEASAPSPSPDAADVQPRWVEILGPGFRLGTIMLVIGIGLHALNMFIVSTTIPSVVVALGNLPLIAWTFTLFAVASIVGAASASALMVRYPLRLGYGLAVVTFALGSLICAVAWSMPAFLVGRVLQGAGGGAISALSYGLIRAIYPRRVWTMALATMSATWGVSSLLGPAFGGLFAEIGLWRGAYLAVAAILVGVLLLSRVVLRPDLRAQETRSGRIPVNRLGLLGLAVFALSLSGNVAALWASALLVVGGLALTAGFFLRDTKSADPLFPRRALVPDRPVGMIYLTILLLSCLTAVVGVYVPLTLQRVFGFTPLPAGYFPTMMAVAWTGGSVLVARLPERTIHLLIRSGPLVMAAGAVGLALSVGQGTPWTVGLALFLIGAGMGACFVHLSSRAMHTAAPGEEGITAGGIPTLQVMGMAFGPAAAGLIANHLGLAEATEPEAVRHAVSWVFAALALSPLAAAVLAAALVRRLAAER